MNNKRKTATGREFLATLKPATYQVQVVKKDGDTKVFSVGPEVIYIMAQVTIREWLAAAISWVAGEAHTAILKNLTSGGVAKIGSLSMAETEKEFVFRIGRAVVEAGVDSTDPDKRCNCRYAVHFFNRVFHNFPDNEFGYTSFDYSDVSHAKADNRALNGMRKKVSAATATLKGSPVRKRKEVLSGLLKKLETEVLAIAAPEETKSITQAVKPARKKAATKA